MRDQLVLSTALGHRGNTEALRDGSVTPDGIHLRHVEVTPIIGAFRRMVRNLEFDVCELAPTAYLMAREVGLPITALPVFLLRMFHHGDIVCRAGAGIRRPRDLAGRRVGMRAYSVAAGVWVRGMLAHDHGLDLDDVTWVVDDDDHVVSYRAPRNVDKLGWGRSIAAEFGSGGIDAALTGPAGVGRSGPASATWRAPAAAPVAGHEPLFPDAAGAAADWHRRTGVYPLHSVVVVHNEVLESHPWVAGALVDAFDVAKQSYLDRLAAGGPDGPDSPDSPEDDRNRALRAVVGPDPLPYGIAENHASLAALIDIAHEQKLIREKPSVESLFAR